MTTMESFKNKFKAMCQNKSQGLTIMEIFMQLNDQTLTLSQLQEWVQNLYDNGLCKIFMGEATDINSRRFIYSEKTAETASSSSSSSLSSSSSSMMGSSPSQDFLHNFLQTYQKSEEQLKATFQENFSKMLDMNQQMIEQQKQLLTAMQNSQIVAPASKYQKKTQNSGVYHHSDNEDEDEDDDDMPSLTSVSSSSSSSGSSSSSSSSSGSSSSTGLPELVAKGQVNNAFPEVVHVMSFTGNNTYAVDLTNMTCTCPNFEFVQSKTHGQCKHLKAALETANASH